MTSNPFFARAMARVVLGYLRDLTAAGGFDASAPLNVVELAAGSGQFAFAFVRCLREIKAAVPALGGLRVRYVMTDFTEANVSAWRAHERLRPFVDEGLLDFAVFDLERDGEVRLQETGETLAAGGGGNPLVVLASYAFDSTRQDCFRVQDHTLWERLVTTRLTGTDTPDPIPLDRLRLVFESAPVPPACYDDPLSNRVLERYRESVGDTAFLFPVAALQCMRRLLDVSGGRLFLLCGDKGVAHEEQLRSRGDPVMTLHGGVFSFVVNLHAIGRYFEEAGGLALYTAQHAADFQVAGFLCGLPAAALRETRRAFAAEIDDFGPAEFFALVKAICTDYGTPPLEALLALLRLCGGDLEVLYTYREVLVAQARQATDAQRRQLRRALRQAWDAYAPRHRDLAFELARISIALREPEDARGYCEESLRLFGRTPGALVMLAFSHTLLGDHASGLRVVDEALALQPDSKPALDLRARLRAAPERG
jgi:hypothetical protein